MILDFPLEKFKYKIELMLPEARENNSQTKLSMIFGGRTFHAAPSDGKIICSKRNSVPKLQRQCWI